MKKQHNEISYMQTVYVVLLDYE